MRGARAPANRAAPRTPNACSRLRSRPTSPGGAASKSNVAIVSCATHDRIKPSTDASEPSGGVGQNVDTHAINAASSAGDGGVITARVQTTQQLSTNQLQREIGRGYYARREGSTTLCCAATTPAMDNQLDIADAALRSLRRRVVLAMLGSGNPDGEFASDVTHFLETHCALDAGAISRHQGLRDFAALGWPADSALLLALRRALGEAQFVRGSLESAGGVDDDDAASFVTAVEEEPDECVSAEERAAEAAGCDASTACDDAAATCEAAACNAAAAARDTTAAARYAASVSIHCDGCDSGREGEAEARDDAEATLRDDAEATLLAVIYGDEYSGSFSGSSNSLHVLPAQRELLPESSPILELPDVVASGSISAPAVLLARSLAPAAAVEPWAVEDGDSLSCASSHDVSVREQLNTGGSVGSLFSEAPAAPLRQTLLGPGESLFSRSWDDALSEGALGVKASVFNSSSAVDTAARVARSNVLEERAAEAHARIRRLAEAMAVPLTRSAEALSDVPAANDMPDVTAPANDAPALSDPNTSSRSDSLDLFDARIAALLARAAVPKPESGLLQPVFSSVAAEGSGDFSFSEADLLPLDTRAVV